MQTWMCKHDLGLVEVGMTDFFNDFDSSIGFLIPVLNSKLLIGSPV